jgi:hypothetical protein
VPQLLFPSHYEQFLLARRLELLGAAAGSVRRATRRSSRARSRASRAIAAFANGSARVRESLCGYSPQEQRRRVVARIEQIIDRSPILSRSSQGPAP